MRIVTTFQQCCHVVRCCGIHMMTVHSLQCHLPCRKILQIPTPWARSLNICYERCSLLFTPKLHTVFAKRPKTRNNKAENCSSFVRGKNKTLNFEILLTRAHKKYFEPGRLNNSCNLSAVLSCSPLLWYAYDDGPQFTVSSPLLKNITNTYPVGQLAKYLL